MSVYTDRVEIDRSLPISYSINIQTSKRPLTCYITTSPSKEINSNKSTLSTKKRRDNQSRSTIHLPVTYSTSIHLPCQSSNIKPHSPMILPSPISYHHYHHHYYHHHHCRQTSRTIKQKISPHSTRPTTTSSTTITSPDSSLTPIKKLQKNPPPPTPSSPPPLPSYSALVWNWFHHRSRRPISPPSPHKGSQSEYSEMCRHESPSKRTLLFKFLTSSSEKPSKSKPPRPCFTRKRSQSSSSLPHKSTNYHE